ncbi:MAG: alanyl-tRNA editing protein [Acidobacteria bacterium]|nr:alanyl-tRNA editing protein [Acidobacteriota bacterium]
MTTRLYYDDATLLAFHANVLAVEDEGKRVYLDRTAFYPSSGGQPNDTGALAGIAVVDVVEEEGRIAHVLAAPLEAGIREVDGSIDRQRRHDHMQQHSGQHLLSAVFEELFSAPTLSFHLGQEVSTIELGVPSLTAVQMVEAERRANELVWDARPLHVSYEDAASAPGLRKASEREGTLRIVNIQDYDRSACGGTHVRNTAAIGLILVRKQEKIRGNVRVEFLCGLRALRQARVDFETLNEVGRAFSSPPEDTPALVTNLLAKANDLEKAKRKLAVELATFQGRQLYETTPEVDGFRRVVQRISAGPASDEVRTLAQSFVAGSNATFLAVFENPPSLLLAVSKDSGMHAGDLLKPLLAAAGGRGGGNLQLAQGSVATKDALERAVSECLAKLR